EAREVFETLEREPALTSEAREYQRTAEEGLVRSYLETGDYQGAADHLDRLILALPSDQRARAQLTLGNCRYRMKQYAQALIAYKEAAKASDPAVAGEGLYWAGNVCLAGEKPLDAAGYFNEVVSRYPTHP